jgi:hypothetical protein
MHSCHSLQCYHLTSQHKRLPMKDCSQIIYGSINKPINSKYFSMLVLAVITDISNTDVISVCLQQDPSTTRYGNSDSMRITCPAVTHNWNNGPAVFRRVFAEHLSLWPYRWHPFAIGKKNRQEVRNVYHNLTCCYVLALATCFGSKKAIFRQLKIHNMKDNVNKAH